MDAHRKKNRSGESGLALAALFMTLMPLMVLTAAGVMTMSGRQALTVSTLNQEKALMAAESGIDWMLHTVNTGTVVNNAQVDMKLGSGMSFSAVAVDMLTDGIDNDGNGQIDDPGETGYEVTVTGRYRGTIRRLRCYMRPIITLPEVNAAVSLQDPASNLQISGNAFTISGDDFNIDGSPGTGAPVNGVTIQDPGTTESLLSGLSNNQQDNISGLDGPPSAGVENDPIDIQSIVNQIGLVADNALPGGNYTSIPDFGSPSEGDWRITHSQGNLKISGNQEGAGILAVDGDLELSGTVTYVGIVLVTGNISFSGGGSSKMLRGGLLVGGDASVGGVFSINGTVDIQFSGQAVAEVKKLSNRHMVSGWLEIARS